MIIIPFIIFLLMVFAKVQKGAFAAFLVLVATKSIVDAFWEIKFGPLSILAVQGILIPILFFEVFKKRKWLPKYWISGAKIYAAAMSFGLIWAIVIRPIETIEVIILNINIFLGFLLIPLLITDQIRLKKFLVAIMICGIFPIMVSLYQLQTGVIFQERATVGLDRYVGFYHDAFPTRFYGLMTLLSILIYQYTFKIKGILFKCFILVLSGGAFLSIYAVFSKAGVGILGLWTIMLLLMSKSKVKQIFSIVIGLSVIFIVFGDAVSDNIQQLFSKEVGYQSGQVKDVRYTLAGRGYIWQEYWEFWTQEQNVFFQWVGDGISRPVHNEFFRVLLTNGIIGVLFLVVFLFKVARISLKMNKNVRVFGLMLFGMYFIDSIGLVPGLYYYYNILVWGIFGILLMKPQLFIKQ